MMEYRPTSQTGKPANYCIVCLGYGGWDRFSSSPRWPDKNDTSSTYVYCIWCSESNTVRRIT